MSKKIQDLYLLEDIKTFPKDVETVVDFSNNPNGRYQLDVCKDGVLLGRYYYPTKKQAKKDEYAVELILNK